MNQDERESASLNPHKVVIARCTHQTGQDVLKTMQVDIARIEDRMMIVQKCIVSTSFATDGEAVLMTDHIDAELQEMENKLQKGSLPDDARFHDMNKSAILLQQRANCLMNSWEWLQRLMSCGQKHLKYAAHYNQYFFDLREITNAMNVNLTHLLGNISDDTTKSTLSAADLDQFVNQLKELFEALEYWQSCVHRIYLKAVRIYPINLRTTKIRKPMWVETMTHYTAHNNQQIQAKQDLLLLDNSDSQEWKLEDHEGKTVLLPATIVLIPPPSSEAIEAAKRLRSELMTLWTRVIKKTAKRMFWFLIILIKKWNNSEEDTLRSLSDEERCTIIDFLTQFEEMYAVTWAGHPGLNLACQKAQALKTLLKSYAGGHDGNSITKTSLTVSSPNHTTVGRRKFMTSMEELEMRTMFDGDDIREGGLSSMTSSTTEKTRTAMGGGKKGNGSYSETTMHVAGGRKSFVKSSEDLRVHSAKEPEFHERVISIKSGGHRKPDKPKEEFHQSGGSYETITRTIQSTSGSTAHTGGGNRFVSRDKATPILIVDSRRTMLDMLMRLKSLNDGWNFNAIASELGQSHEQLLMAESLSKLKVVHRDDILKMWQTQMQMESKERTEHWQDPYDIMATNETVHTRETEKMTQHVHEETASYGITGVYDYQKDEQISLNEAIELGVINKEEGIYYNRKTRQRIPIDEAIAQQLIQIDIVRKNTTKEEQKSYGLITIETKRDTRPYTLLEVWNADKDCWLTPREAIKEGVLDEKSKRYRMAPNQAGGEDYISMVEAINLGFVKTKVDENAKVKKDEGVSEVIARTYAVVAVVDQQLKDKVPYHEAVQKGIIDAETGIYRNNQTGETFDPSEAIRRGFLKVKLIQNPSKIDTNPESSDAVTRINKFKNVARVVGGLASVKKGKEENF